MTLHILQATMAIVLPNGSSLFSEMNSARSFEDICSVSLHPSTELKLEICPFPDMVLHEIFSTLQLMKNKRLSRYVNLNVNR